ncbi:disease resistance protein RPP2B-like [Vitis riparia]|uniref:disease resistance protein RPP2B-like n=1 Tax=Vitis riparia TaxID=96939 RepID=UPI00155A5EC4|nr:disease resistance protein RPP2B-like [Vitis riparia]
MEDFDEDNNEVDIEFGDIDDFDDDGDGDKYDEKCMKHLSELSLEGTGIKGLPLSIEYLARLVLLNLRNYCLKLKELPEVLENMWSLLELFLDGTAIKELPSSIQHLSGLVLLNLRECKSLAILPHSICTLKSLQTLILSGFSKLDNLPEGLGSLQALEKLEAAGTAIKELPPSISLLENLEVLSFKGCKGLEFKPRNSLLSFQLLPAEIPHSGDLSRNNFVSLTCKPHQLSQLKGLRLGYCKRLQSLPELPSRIEEIDAHDCIVMENILCRSSVYTDPRNVGASDSHFLIASDCLRMKAATLWQLH